jgi:hypothetical protein
MTVGLSASPPATSPTCDRLHRRHLERHRVAVEGQPHQLHPASVPRHRRHADQIQRGHTPLAGLSPNYIDTFIVKVGSTYHNFSKNETTKYIEHGTATSLTGPFTISGKADWAGWGANLEGPALFQLPGGGWRILMDGYGNGHYYYSDSADLLKWSAKKDLPGGLSGTVRHGTVLPE